MIEISGYRIIKQLGRGGMAVVYLALQESLDRYVALKVLSNHLSAEATFCDRFMREARIAARFLHRSIVAIYDINSESGRPYMAMEYLPGGTLSSRIPELSMHDKLVVAAEIADALNFMHKQSFIHRDVKPDNIIFRADGSAVITDFGIARAANSVTRMTLTGSILGTPHYMSPEQARGKKIDSRADLYSLGVVLFKMLAGKLPYDAEDQFSICAMHVNEPVPQLPDEVSHLQPIIEKLLAKNPDDRYQSGEALHKALELAAGSSLLMLRTGPGLPEVTICKEPEYQTPTKLQSDQTRLAEQEQAEPATRANTGPDRVPETKAFTDAHRDETGQAHLDPGNDATRIQTNPGDSAIGISPDSRFRALWRAGLNTGLKQFAVTRVRLNVWRQALERTGGLKGVLQRAGSRLHQAWWGPSGLFRSGMPDTQQLKKPEVWTPLLIMLVPIPVVIMLWSDGERPTMDQQPFHEPATENSVALASESIPNAEATFRTLAQFMTQAETVADWIMANQTIEKLQGQVDLHDLDAAPERQHLLELLDQKLLSDGPTMLADKTARTFDKWQAIEPASSPLITESDLLARLEALAAEAARRRLHQAGDLARQGNWDGEEGAWSQFALALAMMPSASQGEQIHSEMRLLWLDQWQDQLSQLDAEAARAFYQSALDAGLLGEQWLIEKAQQLDALDKAIARASLEEQIAVLLQNADEALEADRLMVPEGRNAFEAYQAVLELDPDNHRARSGLRLIAERYAELARLALDQGQLRVAQNHLARAEQLAPDLPQLPELTEWLDAVEDSGQQVGLTARPAIRLPGLNLSGRETIQTLIDRGENEIRNHQPLRGYAYFLAASQRDPDHPGVRRRLDQRAQRYIRLATRDLANMQLDDASQNLAMAHLLAPDHPDYRSADRALRNAMDRARGQSISTHRTQAHLTRLRLKVMIAEARASLDRLIVDPTRQRLAMEAAEKLDQARRIAPQDTMVQQLNQQFIRTLINAADLAIDHEMIELAGWYIDQLGQADPGNPGLTQLRNRLNNL